MSIDDEFVVLESNDALERAERRIAEQNQERIQLQAELTKERVASHAYVPILRDSCQRLWDKEDELKMAKAQLAEMTAWRDAVCVELTKFKASVTHSEATIRLQLAWSRMRNKRLQREYDRVDTAALELAQAVHYESGVSIPDPRDWHEFWTVGKCEQALCDFRNDQRDHQHAYEELQDRYSQQLLHHTTRELQEEELWAREAEKELLVTKIVTAWLRHSRDGLKRDNEKMTRNIKSLLEDHVAFNMGDLKRDRDAYKTALVALSASLGDKEVADAIAKEREKLAAKANYDAEAAHAYVAMCDSLRKEADAE